MNKQNGGLYENSNMLIGMRNTRSTPLIFNAKEKQS
jgi:hypothetical protein